MAHYRRSPLRRDWVKDSDLFQRYGMQLTDRQRFAVKVVLLVVKDFECGNVGMPCEVLPESRHEAIELSAYMRAVNRLAVFGERGF